MTSTVLGSPKTVTVEYSSLCICSGRGILLIIRAVKTISLFYGLGDGPNGAQESALSRGSALCGGQLATETTARVKIHRRQKSAALIRLGMDVSVRDQTGWGIALFYPGGGGRTGRPRHARQRALSWGEGPTVTRRTRALPHERWFADRRTHRLRHRTDFPGEPRRASGGAGRTGRGLGRE